MKRKIFIVLILLIITLNFYSGVIVARAEDGNEFIDGTKVYTVYDEDFNIIFQKDYIELGDGYLSKNYKYYEVTYVDNDNYFGLAKFVRDVPRPNVSVDYNPSKISIDDRTICMYMTHNDESYVPTDGYDSIYGNGGIRDVALAFKSELEKFFIDVHFDDTLHIPHDSNAYSRSSITANKLFSKHSPDAIFDIHRDGTSRSFYVANVNGKERGRVRIVIGKANPNMEINEEFALYLMAVGNELYPWLFTDIYYANGHYNQAIDGKALLFEMGSHLIEKELEIESMKELAEVVTTALYKTTVNKDTGDLTVNGDETTNDVIVKDIIEEKQIEKIENNNGILVASVIMVIFASMCVTLFVIIHKSYKKEK